jgi:ubiquinone/menaquinone biosynthesis C-methylase UbiE
MKSFLKNIWRKESFSPSYLLGLWINPVFIIRKGLINGIKEISSYMKGGKLLDVGCGSKPYKAIFDVDEYIGIDIEVSGHNHNSSDIDKYYDGKVIPYDNNSFDHVFSSEVFEHVFNIDELLNEIHRVLKVGGKFCFTCPFVWDEHEQPYDYARYTSFAIHHLLSKHGFELIKLDKSTSYVETVFQMLSAYVYQNVLPKNNYIRILLTPFVIAPINITGLLFGYILPKNHNFYHNNIVVAQKAQQIWD